MYEEPMAFRKQESVKGWDGNREYVFVIYNLCDQGL